MDPKPQLQWAYLTYALGPAWDLQLGRKRIPLYYYSGFQDVGMAYPWVNTPPELYGWEVTNDNGISLRNRSNVGDVFVNSSIFAGIEGVKDGRFMLTYGQKNTDVAWNPLVGGDVEIVKDRLTLRAMYLRTETSFADRDDASLDWSEKMQAYGVAANLDFNDWFVLSEWATNVRDTRTGPIAGIKMDISTVSLGAGTDRCSNHMGPSIAS